MYDGLFSIEEDCMWEPHRRVTGSPTNRHDHSFTYIPEGNFCILYGGMITTGHGTVCMNDLWSLHWYFSEIDELTLRWEKIRTSGIPPSPRSRHVACYFPHRPQQKNRIESLHSSSTNIMNPSESLNEKEETTNSTSDNYHGSLIIFGGIDETIRQENEVNDQGNEILLDEKTRDSIIHILKWKMTKKDDYRMNVSHFRWTTKTPPPSTTGEHLPHHNSALGTDPLFVPVFYSWIVVVKITFQ